MVVRSWDRAEAMPHNKPVQRTCYSGFARFAGPLMGGVRRAQTRRGTIAWNALETDHDYTQGELRHERGRTER